MKKKILFIVEAMGGGVFTYIVDLANNLVNDYDIFIAYATREQTPCDFKKYFDKRIKLIKVNSFCREIKLSNDVKSIIELRKIKNIVNPDIIHLHSSKAGVLGRVAFGMSKIPLFYTPHGYSFLMENCNTYKRKFYKLIEYIMAKTKCITISCSYGEHLETLKLTKRAFYINNAINVSFLKNKLDNIINKDHNFTVFTLGRICYQKNPELFNDIAGRLPSIKFLWIGDGELRNKLSSKNIEITGWVNREMALEISKNADVFILTSRWEGLPISLLEAMLMKKLCVVSNVIGNNNVIKNNINGFICNNTDEFVEKIMVKDNQITENAYLDIIQNYSTENQAKSYSDIYQRSIFNE